MRRALRLFIPLTIVGATLVTGMIAAPNEPSSSPVDIRSITLQQTASLVQQTTVVVSLIAVWMLAAVALTLMSGREVRASSTEVRASALHCFTLGLVAVTSFVLTAIVFSYLVPYFIGIPLLFALAVFAVITKIYGMIAVFHAVGTLVAGARTRNQLDGRKWLRGDLAMAVIGVLILGAIRLIPMVGPIVWGLASVFGIGSALATKFGRREPWFLVWRPAEM
jgi:hypothetical protein